MDPGLVLRRARFRAGLSLRALASRAGTSHSALVAYEGGDKAPSATTLSRIVRGAGFSLEVDLAPLAGGPDRAARGRELADVIELASHFPARHSQDLEYPPFRRLA